jgi:hypothetical protein
MQEDEEIGKVAQGTPIVICALLVGSLVALCVTDTTTCLPAARALELLLRDIIVETADIARTSGSKKLQPWHVYVSW